MAKSDQTPLLALAGGLTDAFNELGCDLSIADVLAALADAHETLRADEQDEARIALTNL